MKQEIAGWRKDKFDHRDYLHKPLFGFTVIPNAVNLEDFLPDVRHQGSVGSCVGFGIGANLAAHALKQGVYHEWFSPTWIYNGARFLEGTLSQDVGCWPRDALKWLKDKGCLLEQFWPYNPLALDRTSPPSHLEPEAAKWPLLEYYRVTNGVEGICSALADEFCVSIGTPWFSKWEFPTAGKLPEVTSSDRISGGHETCLYGYDKKAEIFLGINSWGDSWGNQGLFTMPFQAFQVFNQCGGYDAHYIKVNWNDIPEPEPPKPEPQKKLRLRGQISFDAGDNWRTVLDIPLSCL